MTMATVGFDNYDGEGNGKHLTNNKDSDGNSG
jgi:hypothetical protein